LILGGPDNVSKFYIPPHNKINALNNKQLEQKEFLNLSIILNYIKIARIDHWFKNVFMLPGTALAISFANIPIWQTVWPTMLAVLSTCLIASANYVINEWLDAEFDRHHPVKQYRPSVLGNLRKEYVYFEYGLLVAVGLSLASLLTPEFFRFSVLLLVMGIIYNVRPLRTKDRLYLDVLSESINNPLRLLLGWSALLAGTLPPSSILIAYWMGGAFLMTVKRYAEYRFINDPDRAELYRRSFRYYNEERLLLSSFFYGLSSAFFLGIFLIKYRIEFLLTFPLFALLFAWYLKIGMRPYSTTQNPEKLYREKAFVAYVIFLCCAVTALFFVDIPWLKFFMERVDY
jgi:decaprenyl-phosphate phosphoribosyltransferase